MNQEDIRTSSSVRTVWLGKLALLSLCLASAACSTGIAAALKH